MRSVTVGHGEAPHRVEATAVICGRDLTVCFGGGSSPHIGAAALGSPRPSLADRSRTSASVSTLCVVGHKEDLLARNAAARLAASFHCQVVVTVGLHVDEATPDEIHMLGLNFEGAIDDLEHSLKSLLEQWLSAGTIEVS